MHHRNVNVSSIDGDFVQGADYRLLADADGANAGTDGAWPGGFRAVRHSTRERSAIDFSDLGQSAITAS